MRARAFLVYDETSPDGLRELVNPELDGVYTFEQLFGKPTNVDAVWATRNAIQEQRHPTNKKHRNSRG